MRDSVTIAIVNINEAAALLGGMPLDTSPAVWADLGCGEGTFTLALATLLPESSVIHAMDRDPAVLRRLPPRHAGVSIVTHAGDFAVQPWPFAPPAGVLLANSLHYVQDPRDFLRECAETMAPRPRLLVVEYDTDQPNPWVPYPVERKALEHIAGQAGLTISFLGSKRSVYRRVEIYGASLEAPGSRL